MSKVTKVFNLKTGVKLVVEVTEQQLNELITKMTEMVKLGISATVTPREYFLAKRWLEDAYEGGYDALLESIIQYHYREAIRDFDLKGTDMFDNNGKLTLRPPQLVLKR